MKVSDHYKIGQSVGVRTRLSQVRARFPDTDMYAYAVVQEGLLLFLESALLTCAYERFRDKTCHRGAAGDWFRSSEPEVIAVQTIMQAFAATYSVQ